MAVTLPKAFIRVAQRSLHAGKAALTAHVQEKTTFLAYHAFESLGGAYCLSRGVQFHPASHQEKIRRFVRAAGHERFGMRATKLAIELQSIRNQCLYPRTGMNGQVHQPEQVITEREAGRLVGRVETLARDVDAVV